MKKSIFMLLLCLGPAACGSHGPITSQGSTLLSFEQIGAEISVTHELAEDLASESASAALASTPAN